MNGVPRSSDVVDAVEELVAGYAARRGTVLLRADDVARATSLIGDGIAASGIAEALDALQARRAIVVSEPGAWAAAGEAIAAQLRDAGSDGRCRHAAPGRGGQAAVGASRPRRATSPRLRVERGEPLVAIGGGALGDTAGFIAAT